MSYLQKEVSKVGIIVAARMGSSRLPGKALLKIGQLPMIIFLLGRINSTQKVHKLILATTTLFEDDELAEIVRENEFEVFRGANADVVQRYIDAADLYGLDYVIRVTGDCPFVSGELIDYCLDFLKAYPSFDLASTKGHFPVGLDCEIYSVKAMKRINEFCDLSANDREHLTLYFYKNSSRFQIIPITPKREWISDEIFTVDAPDDLEKAREIYSYFDDYNFTLDALIGKLNENKVFKTIK
jgi:spore coat polysaccharide biosynthesis protein SpsF